MQSEGIAANQNDDSVRSYTDLASSYNEVRFENTVGRFLYETDGEIIRRLVTKTGAKVLVDAPTGTGRVLDYLKGMGLDITAVDATQEMLNVAQTVRSDGNKVKYVIGDASKLDLPSGSVDCLVSLRFFHLFAKHERQCFADEFARVIKPGGYLLVSYTNGWYGLGYYWLKKLLGAKAVFYEYPGEIPRAYPDFTVVALEGNSFNKQYWLRNIPVLLNFSKWLTKRFPFNRICLEKFYLLKKKGS